MEKFVLGNLVDIHSKSIYPAKITISGKQIKRIDKLLTQQKNYILPGFVDSHIHIESSMLTPLNFANIALQHGTVATVSDPHEIANVCGKAGVEYMIKDGNKSKLKFYWSVPSCVPATPFETSGGVIATQEIEELFQFPNMVSLGEMMNFPGVIQKDPNIIEKCKLAKKHHKRIDGHAPGLKGDELLKYIEEGISTDHECTCLEEAQEKIDLGMKILIREGSSAKNFDALCSLIDSDTKSVMLCSDDLHVHDLKNGHINLIVKRAMKCGYSIFDVLEAASKNAVDHYGLDVGLLRIGDNADFIIVDNLSDLSIIETWVEGENVFHKDQNEKQNKSIDNIKIGINNFITDRIQINDLIYTVNGSKGRVIGIRDGEITTESLEMVFHSKDIFSENPQLQKIVVKNRYESGVIGKGLAIGFGPLTGAIASSIAHDSHNIVCLGRIDIDMVNAINAIIDAKGGIAFSKDGNTTILPLTVAGLMSSDDPKEIASAYEQLSLLTRNSGCTLNSPFMTMSFLALLVIPSLKLSDLGLFDSVNFEFTKLFYD